MNPRPALLVLVAALLAAVAPNAQARLALAPLPAQESWTRTSPFTDLRVEGEVVHVRFDEQPYTLVSIAGLASDVVLAHCRKTYGAQWEKRLAEDLVEVLAGLGRPIAGEADLVLADPSGTRVAKPRAPFTAQNRARLYAERKRRAQADPVREQLVAKPVTGTTAGEGGAQPGPEAARGASRVPPGSAAARKEWAKLSPFTDARIRGRALEVRFDDRWHALVTIEGLAAEQVLEHCEKTFGERAEKRFAEDLVEVLGGLGREPQASVDLVLRDLETGALVERRGAPLTKENRQRVWKERRTREELERSGNAAGERGAGAGLPTDGSTGAVRRIEREHAARAAEPYAFLARMRAPLAREPRLARSLAEQDLDQLEWHVEHEYPYRDLAGIDRRAAFDALRVGIASEVGRDALAEGLAKLLALFGDGHSQVESRLAGARSLPFLLEGVADKVVAFEPDRSAFVDPERPRVLALDGVPIERWIEAASTIVARGAPHLVRRRALRGLRDLDFVRRELGLATEADLVVELADLAGANAARRTIPAARTRPVYGPWPRRATQILEGNVGYLRIESMDDDAAFLAELERRMQEFRGTSGLVIDVRGNGGGSRLPLLTLFPYFLRADDPPRIANVAALRLAPGEKESKEGALADRYAWPSTAGRWTTLERDVVERAASAFRPRWTPPPGEFGAWHWLVLARPVQGERPALYTYEKPVVVLQDGGCFSATDIFLAAFQGWRDVTLLGLPSSGGSGRARRVTLANSGISVRLSTMASFRPDGALYDGAGITPDVLVEPGPSWFVGGEDAQLEAALKRLR